MARRDWTVSGWLVFGADGSRLESPRTRANELGLKCAGKVRPAPQVFHTVLQHLGRGKQAVFLLTDVLEPSRLSARQACEIDRRRWGIEVASRTIKQTFDRREWLSRTPRTVLAEHTASLLGLWILQVLSLQSLRRCRRDPRPWSPSRTRDATRRALRRALARSLHEPLTWRDQLGLAVRDRDRRGRSKRARSGPHQKHEPPVRPPQMAELTPSLRLKGQTLLDDS